MLAHALLLAFPGVPAVYVQSILGSRNDLAGVKEAGHHRAINRQKYPLSEIEAELNDVTSLRHNIFQQLSQLIQLRRQQAAFHPDNPMVVLESDNALLVIQRRSERQQLLCIFNLSNKVMTYTLPDAVGWRSVIDGRRIAGNQSLTLTPLGWMWLELCEGDEAR